VRHDAIPLQLRRFSLDYGAERVGVRAETIIAANFEPQLRRKPFQEVVLVPVAHFNGLIPFVFSHNIRRPFCKWDFTASMEKPVWAAVSS
jgi:hypothetical protein